MNGLSGQVNAHYATLSPPPHPDGAAVIERDHLDAALALWQYCFDSARFIFGDSLGNAVADDLRGALDTAGATGLSRTDISKEVFGKNRSARDIAQGLALLREHGLARGEVDSSGAGRPVETWYSTGATKETN